ncbi:MAG TPA: histone deacetylase [Vicinamibacterales bacterium]|nr:histone deacetylase [Vicinamibacterales bacterium]HPK72836.1 histone deacetylase [Vicinamibacterales bacterium]HPW19710.1 histone deacetylase [Vicinamibacterales bacterium]
MRLVYSPRYEPGVSGHILRSEVYGQVVQRLLAAGLVRAADVLEPPLAEWDDLALVHTPDYLDKVRSGSFTTADLALLELPWTPAIAESYLLNAGGTLLAARLALEAAGRAGEAARIGAPREAPPLAAAANIGGGLHHAFPSRGEGFCPVNDVAVAIRVLQRDGAIRRAAVLDADVHQGNGTAFIFAGDPSVFTCSIHQERNYPSIKPPSSLDIGLPDGAGDEEYLQAFAPALPAVVGSRPDIIFYLAGADPYGDDRLGGLGLTMDGLRRRDAAAFAASRDAGIPVAVVLSGGYARDPADTVAIYAATIEEAIGLGA